MFRPLPKAHLFENLLVRQILAVLLIVAIVVGVLLAFSLEHQTLVLSGMSEGKGASPALTAAVGQSRRDLIAITVLLFLVGGASIAAVVAYLHYASTRRNLEEVKGLARHILESIPTGILTISQDGIVTAVNPTAESLLQRSGPSLLGKHYQSVFGEGHPFHLLFHGALDHDVSPASKEFSLESNSGERRTIRISHADLTGDDGKRDGVIFHLHDVTEWLALEKQVNDAQRLAALHTLSAGVAHELRNPLSALDLNLQLLAEELQDQSRLSSRAEAYLQVLDVELNRLSAILDNFMRYTQSRSGESRPVNMRSLVSHVAQLLQHEAADRNQELVVSLPTEMPCIQGDETQITQALINIVINAFQAMPEGGVCHIVLTESERQGRKWVEVTVHDSGPGIKPHDLAHIFDPFYTTKINGTGLGLAIAYRILTNHGGRIEVSCPPGEGTSVVLSLPAVVSVQATVMESV